MLKNLEIMFQSISSNEDPNNLIEGFNIILNSITNSNLDEIVYNFSNRFVNKLISNKITIATAESITGGLLSFCVTRVPGSSKIFEKGVVCYSYAAKMKELNVSHETLKKYSDVSYETCKEMLLGLRNKEKKDIAVVTTGYAGPTGKEIGLAYVGLNVFNNIFIYKTNFLGDRNRIQYLVVLFVIYVLDRMI